MNKQEIEKAIKVLASFDGTEDSDLQNAIEIAVPLLEREVPALTQQFNPEPTAIEFLRKAKTICNARKRNCYMNFGKDECPMYNICCEPLSKITNESDLVRNAMDYRLEDKDETSPTV